MLGIVYFFSTCGGAVLINSFCLREQLYCSYISTQSILLADTDSRSGFLSIDVLCFVINRLAVNLLCWFLCSHTVETVESFTHARTHTKQSFLWQQLTAALWHRETRGWSHIHYIISQACANNLKNWIWLKSACIHTPPRVVPRSERAS